MIKSSLLQIGLALILAASVGSSAWRDAAFDEPARTGPGAAARDAGALPGPADGGDPAARPDRLPAPISPPSAVVLLLIGLFGLALPDATRSGRISDNTQT
jgi:hypothetical protein